MSNYKIKPWEQIAPLLRMPENVFWRKMKENGWVGDPWIDAISSSGNSVLMHSIIYLPEYASLLAQVKEINIHQINTFNENAFFRSVQQDDVETTKILVTRGCDINIRDKDGKTALVHAVANKFFGSKSELYDLIFEKSIGNAEGEKNLEDTLLNLRKDIEKKKVQNSKRSFSFYKNELNDLFDMVAEIEKTRLSLKLQKNLVSNNSKLRL